MVTPNGKSSKPLLIHDDGLVEVFIACCASATVEEKEELNVTCDDTKGEDMCVNASVMHRIRDFAIQGFVSPGIIINVID